MVKSFTKKMNKWRVKQFHHLTLWEFTHNFLDGVDHCKLRDSRQISDHLLEATKSSIIMILIIPQVQMHSLRLRYRTFIGKEWQIINLDRVNFQCLLEL